jgi:hypothetical protein
MKFFTTTMALFMLTYMSMFVGVAMASDTGAGVCAAGIGISFNDVTGAGPYAGVNVGSPVADPTGVVGFGGGSTTGAYDNEADFAAQCCAETGSPPDCFEPVQ